MSNLYTNSERRAHELAQSHQRLEKLTIEYNPLNQIKKDLGVSTRKEELDQENLGIHIEIQQLQTKFGKARRIVDALSIIEFSAGNDYVIDTIKSYRSELTESALQAIQKFANENSIDISKNRDNFFILAPRKFFKTDNLNIDNVAYNIYYRDGYSEYIKTTDNVIELYGSNFKSSWISPLREMNVARTPNEALVCRAMMFFIMFWTAMFSFAVFLNNGVLNGGLIFYNTVLIVFISILLFQYKMVFANKKYLKRIININTFIDYNKLIISL